MVKIVSLILFVSALVWSWCMFNSPAKMGLDIHAGIQSKLTLLIEDTVKAKRPNMKNFTLVKMYTETLDDNKVKAHFSYQFEDAITDQTQADMVTQNITGEATLTKALSEDPLVQKWVLQSVKTGNESVDFKDGLTIISDGNDTEAVTPVTPTETKETH